MSDLWVFIKYLVKKPFIDMWAIITRFSYPKAWLYLSAIGYLISRFVDIGIWSDGFLIILFISVIWHEYIKGEWKREWREKYKQQKQ